MQEEYWENYNAATDFDALGQVIPSNQDAAGSNLKLQKAGYDPLWVWETYGDRLKLLPGDLYSAVFDAMRDGGLLSNQWAEDIALYIPDFQK